MYRKNNWIAFTGFSILSVAVISLLGLTVYEAWLFHSSGGLISVFLIFGALIAIYKEAEQIPARLPTKTEKSSKLLQAISVFVGGIITYAVSHDLGLGPVISASVIALLAYMIVPQYSVSAYCGSFVGMTSNLLIYNYHEVALASLIAGIIFLLTSDVFNGFGGKLGTIALIGTAITCRSLNRDFLMLSIGDFQTNVLVILVATIATPLTYYFNVKRKQGPVLASAVVGIISAMILPPLFPEIGNNLAVVAICASFAGMTSQKRCSKFWNMLVTGLLTGIVFVYSTPQLGGAGGKLGTVAFGAVLSTCGYQNIIKNLKSKI